MDRKNIHGVLLLNKPSGITSNSALQRAKRLFNAKKAGHTGSLDPIASGLLPICFGEATKFSQFLLNADKHYVVSAILGIKTDTADREGAVITTRPVSVSHAQLEEALSALRGDIQQIPSMYSALKHQGQPLYKLARQGKTIERAPRNVTVHELTLLEWQGTRLKLEVRVTKGTYVRNLVEDLGELLGCGAHVVELHRTGIGSYLEKQMISFETLENQLATQGPDITHFLLPPQAALEGIPVLKLPETAAYSIRRGVAITLASLENMGIVQLFSDDRFMGIGEVLADGHLVPRRLTQESVSL